MSLAHRFYPWMDAASPHATQKPERKRILYVCEHELPAEVFDQPWHQQGKANRVDELVLLEDESMMPIQMKWIVH